MNKNKLMILVGIFAGSCGFIGLGYFFLRDPRFILFFPFFSFYVFSIEGIKSVKFSELNTGEIFKKYNPSIERIKQIPILILVLIIFMQGVNNEIVTLVAALSLSLYFIFYSIYTYWILKKECF